MKTLFYITMFLMLHALVSGTALYAQPPTTATVDIIVTVRLALTPTPTPTPLPPTPTPTPTPTPAPVTLTYTAVAHGSISGTSPQTVNYGGSGGAVTAVPNTGYYFVDWSDGSTDNPRTDTNVTADINVIANFAINTYILTYTAGANGTISGASPQTVNYGDDGTTVTAVSATGYHFINWSDNVMTAPRADMNVTTDTTVMATFAINTYMLTYTAGAHGSINGTSPQTVNYGDSGSAVAAVPDTNYRFVKWSDGSTANPRTDVDVTANIIVTANFAIITQHVTFPSSWTFY
jgi:hypothetical protein